MEKTSDTDPRYPASIDTLVSVLGNAEQSLRAFAMRAARRRDFSESGSALFAASLLQEISVGAFPETGQQREAAPPPAPPAPPPAPRAPGAAVCPANGQRHRFPADGGPCACGAARSKRGRPPKTNGAAEEPRPSAELRTVPIAATLIEAGSKNAVHLIGPENPTGPTRTVCERLTGGSIKITRHVGEATCAACVPA